MTQDRPERAIPDPRMNTGDEAYFAAAAEGRLVLRMCRQCGQAHHYPRALCPFCFSDDLEWRDASGRGVIHTYSVTRRGVPAAYCIAYVTLEEGVTMLSNLVDCDFDAVRIGQRVHVVFRKSEGGVSVPMFAPDATMEAP